MEYLAFILPAVEGLGIWSYWLILLISLFESFAFVGSFIPGSTTVVVSGFLAAQGYLDWGDLIIFSSIGAILGDIFSYWLGTKGLNYFKDENKYLKRAHLERGEAFFKKHGNKSVFLGRFIAPIRSIVPFVAGLSKMDKKAFLFWNILSGIIWAAAHVLVGYFFGEAWRQIETWYTRIGMGVLVLMLIGIVIYLIRHKE